MLPDCSAIVSCYVFNGATNRSTMAELGSAYSIAVIIVASIAVSSSLTARGLTRWVSVGILNEPHGSSSMDPMRSVRSAEWLVLGRAYSIAVIALVSTASLTARGLRAGLVCDIKSCTFPQWLRCSQIKEISLRRSYHLHRSPGKEVCQKEGAMKNWLMFVRDSLSCRCRS